MFALLLLAVPKAFAQLTPPYLIPESGSLGAGCNFVTGDLHYHCIPIYLGYLIQLVFGVTGTICLLMIIWSGYEWALAALQGGDSNQAKQRLRNALLGFAFCVLVFLMVDTIISAVFT